jgi:hypothetical protein
MKKMLALVLMLGLATAYAADDKKSESKKKAKPAAKSAEKSDKNVFQRTESSIGQWAHENKIWVRGASSKK